VQALVDLAGEVRGAKVLDLACGHGLVARALASRGAIVTGLDLSGELIDHARSLEARATLGIEYVQGDAADARSLDGLRFDVVVCNFGLSDIDDIERDVATVSRVLVNGGRFAFSILHPCFGGDSRTSGSWPADGSYYDERWWLADGEFSTLRREVGANHRMLSTYINLLVSHGQYPDAVAEPPPEPSFRERSPLAALQPVYLVVGSRFLPDHV
jgi:SAM-dependent methyltransferase